MHAKRTLAELISRGLRLTAGSIADLARDAGASRAALYSWAAGTRNPTEENRRTLAEAFRRRGGELEKLADELEGSV